MFNIDPKKMQAMMKQLGMKQEEIQANKAIIERTNGSKLIIEPAQITKIVMQGQESFQIVGNVREENSEAEKFSEENFKKNILNFVKSKINAGTT